MYQTIMYTYIIVIPATLVHLYMCLHVFGPSIIIIVLTSTTWHTYVVFNVSLLSVVLNCSSCPSLPLIVFVMSSLYCTV